MSTTRSKRPPALPSASSSSLYCGTVEMVVEELRRYEALGVEMVFLPSQQRELIAKEILPEFRK